MFQRWNPWRTGQVGRDGIVGLEDLPPFNETSSPVSPSSSGSSTPTISLLNTPTRTVLDVPNEIPEYINNPFSE